MFKHEKDLCPIPGQPTKTVKRLRVRDHVETESGVIGTVRATSKGFCVVSWVNDGKKFREKLPRRTLRKVSFDAICSPVSSELRSALKHSTSEREHDSEASCPKSLCFSNLDNSADTGEQEDSHS